MAVKWRISLSLSRAECAIIIRRMLIDCARDFGTVHPNWERHFCCFEKECHTANAGVSH